MIKQRTRVYVDGFNIYYGIRFTPYRWRDDVRDAVQRKDRRSAED